MTRPQDLYQNSKATISNLDRFSLCILFSPQVIQMQSSCFVAKKKKRPNTLKKKKKKRILQITCTAYLTFLLLVLSDSSSLNSLTVFSHSPTLPYDMISRDFHMILILIWFQLLLLLPSPSGGCLITKWHVITTLCRNCSLPYPPKKGYI